jgi:hypothetical protein
VAWIVRVVRVHGRRSREALVPAAPTIVSFLTDLAVPGHVAAATQPQAMKARVCLDARLLNHALPGHIKAVRADQQSTVPVVMTRAAVAAVISLLGSTAPLVAQRLSGSGVRLMAAVRLRGKDLEVQMQPRTVRSGQGTKDQFPTGPATLPPWLQHHLAKVKTWP